MDYSKIKLDNERNSHVVKRLNKLGAWGFFKVLYRDNMWRLLGFSMLMLIMLVPIVVVQYFSARDISQLYMTLPTFNGFGFSTGVWSNLESYYNAQVHANTIYYGLFTVLASLAVFVIISGGFAVIRDGYWTGKISTVGVFRSIGMGIAAGFAYALATVVIVAFGVFGIVMFFNWLSKIIFWLAIVLTVLLSLALLLVVCYLLILCSVAVTYKQSLKDNLSDSWRLLWLNFLPNIIHVVLALIPVGLYFLFSSGMLQMLYLVFMIMFGGMYFPLVWQTFMMRTFALFHPVEAKKKKDVQREIAEKEAAEAAARNEANARREARKNQKQSKKAVVKKNSAQKTNNATEKHSEAVAEPDPYAVENDDPYKNDAVSDTEITDASGKTADEDKKSNE